MGITQMLLHMNKGEGENSYAMNSTLQNQIIKVASPMMEQAVADTLRKTSQPQSMGLADLGCASGPNSLMAISILIDALAAATPENEMPELRISLNDLPGNDFNSVFASLPGFYDGLTRIGVDECFVSGVPGSFYGKLFPKKSLHFVHSSSSLHWLSRVPSGLDEDSKDHPNKGKIYVSKTSPFCVFEAYRLQFWKDFFDFLRFRADEMVAGGGMLLSFMGRASADASAEVGSHQWELLAQALMSMVRQGHVKEEDIDSLNVPYYAPTAEEVRNVIEEEGSFVINHLEAFEIGWDEGSVCKVISRGQHVANNIRAVVESMLELHFGKGIIDELFVRYGKLVDHYFSLTEAKHINLVIYVTRKD